MLSQATRNPVGDALSRARLNRESTHAGRISALEAEVRQLRDLVDMLTEQMSAAAARSPKKTKKDEE